MQFPEHTLESYKAAALQGAGVIECDVTFTKDRELVCKFILVYVSCCVVAVRGSALFLVVRLLDDDLMDFSSGEEDVVVLVLARLEGIPFVDCRVCVCCCCICRHQQQHHHPILNIVSFCLSSIHTLLLLHNPTNHR